MKTLDRTKSFGTIAGDQQGRVFEQNSTFFCADGTEWGVPKSKPADVPQDAADSQLDAQLETAETEQADIAPAFEKPKAKPGPKKKPVAKAKAKKK